MTDPWAAWREAAERWAKKHSHYDNPAWGEPCDTCRLARAVAALLPVRDAAEAFYQEWPIVNDDDRHHWCLGCNGEQNLTPFKPGECARHPDTAHYCLVPPEFPHDPDCRWKALHATLAAARAVAEGGTG